MLLIYPFILLTLAMGASALLKGAIYAGVAGWLGTSRQHAVAGMRSPKGSSAADGDEA